MNQLQRSTLAELAKKANEAHKRAEEYLRGTLAAWQMRRHDAFRRAIESGEALVEAKRLVEHGEWLQWLSENFNGSVRIAQRWMRIAERKAELESGRAVVD